jgi:hypothetical protein
MSNYTRSHNDLLVGDFVIKTSGLASLITVMNNSGYAVNVVPINDERVRVIVTEAKGGFYE